MSKEMCQLFLLSLFSPVKGVVKWVIHITGDGVSDRKKRGISFWNMLLKDHIVFLGAFSIINQPLFLDILATTNFFTIINNAAKENIWQEVQSGRSLTQQDEDWVERTRSLIACADLLGRKVGNKYPNCPLLLPSDLMLGLPVGKGGGMLCFGSAPIPGHGAEWPWMGRDNAWHTSSIESWSLL